MRSKLAAAIISVCSAYAVAGPAEPVSSAELKFRDQMGLGNYQSVEYRDLGGAQIDFEQFQKLRPGQAFTLEKKREGDRASAVVKLIGASVNSPALKSRLVPGKDFPAFKLRATDGSVVDNASLRGRYTVLNFYFSECAPCIKEVPMLNDFVERNKEYGALAVTFDSPDEAKQFAQRTRFNWRTLANAKELIDQVGVKAFPSFALLDPSGVVVATGNSMDIGMQGATLDKWVSKAIASRPQ